jgi:hypothetical protein
LFFRPDLQKDYMALDFPGGKSLSRGRRSTTEEGFSLCLRSASINAAARAAFSLVKHIDLHFLEKRVPEIIGRTSFQSSLRTAALVAISG